jgi:hypothetical protein
MVIPRTYFPSLIIGFAKFSGKLLKASAFVTVKLYLEDGAHMTSVTLA